MYKSERREKARRNARKMRVEGRSVFVILRAQEKRDKKRREAAREGKRVSPMTI